MRNLKRVLKVYGQAAREALRNLLRSPLLIVFSIANYFIWLGYSAVFGDWGFVGGMILGIIQIVLLTYFYSWVASAVRREKISVSDLATFDYSMFSSLLSVAFIFFIVDFVAQSMIQGLDVMQILLFLNLALVFLFNAIPEVIVLHRYQSLPALTYALQFTRDNFLAWFIPIIVLFAPLIALSPQAALFFFAKSDPLLPAALIFNELGMAFGALHGGLTPIAIVVALWFTLFRMHLFLELDGRVS